jgi:hypothetical protein
MGDNGDDKQGKVEKKIYLPRIPVHLQWNFTI